MEGKFIFLIPLVFFVSGSEGQNLGRFSPNVVELSSVLRLSEGHENKYGDLDLSDPSSLLRNSNIIPSLLKQLIDSGLYKDGEGGSNSSGLFKGVGRECEDATRQWFQEISLGLPDGPIRAPATWALHSMNFQKIE